MKVPPKTAPLATFVWTIILIVVLASFAFLTILTNSKSETIRDNIHALNEENTNYHQLDSSISLLYIAENNSRLFVITADSSYLKAYRKQLNGVMSILARYQDERKKQSLSSLISKKKVRNEEFISLKLMLDSLLFLSENPQTFKSLTTILPTPKISRSQQIQKSDSVVMVAAVAKKRLFKRIADAIANKERDSTTVSRLESNTVIIHDTVQVKEPFQEVNESNINKKFNLVRRELNAAELRVLKINDRIFLNIQSSLKALKAEEEENAKAFKNSIVSATSSKFEDVYNLSWGNVLVVLVLAIMIIGNLIRLYKNEKTIIQYADLTAETSKKKGAFLAQVAHEIRTPLNSIIGFSQLIDTQKLEESLKVNINAIKSSSRILLALVNEILDFSKFESGKITLLNKNFYPIDVFEDALAILSVLAAEKQITIATQLNLDRKISLTGDDFRIKQILINLITNAIKFTQKNGRITVGCNFEKTTDEKGLLRISVKDSGVGIAKEHIDTIFDDFIQVETADSLSRHLGTGLGLAICKRIVDLYGGQISVDSVFGKGAEFKVVIPLKTASKMADGNVEQIADPDKEVILKGRKFLLVDDTRINLLLLGKIMDKHGVEYDLASDGKKAFELFETGTYDLIITDIHMPEMNGVELIKRIRKNPDAYKSTIPVLAFTGSSTEENKVYYTSMGMNEVLEKPFEESQLMSTLNRLLYNRSNA